MKAMPVFIWALLVSDPDKLIKIYRCYSRYLTSLQEEINRMKNSFNYSQTQSEIVDMEAQKYKDLYHSEVRIRERLAGKLQKATERAAQAQL